MKFNILVLQFFLLNLCIIPMTQAKIHYLKMGKARIEKVNAGQTSSPIIWKSKKIQVTWKQFMIGSMTRWRPILSVQTSNKKQNSHILFEATNKDSVYWGAPLRIVWLANDKELLVRLVEFTGLGSPAYAACLKIGINDDKLQLLASAEPGRDWDCPVWAKPVTEASSKN